jgi:hypothetical protein
VPMAARAAVVTAVPMAARAAAMAARTAAPEY